MVDVVSALSALGKEQPSIIYRGGVKGLLLLLERLQPDLLGFDLGMLVNHLLVLGWVPATPPVVLAVVVNVLLEVRDVLVPGNVLIRKLCAEFPWSLRRGKWGCGETKVKRVHHGNVSISSAAACILCIAGKTGPSGQSNRRRRPCGALGPGNGTGRLPRCTPSSCGSWRRSWHRHPSDTSSTCGQPAGSGASEASAHRARKGECREGGAQVTATPRRAVLVVWHQRAWRVCGGSRGGGLAS